MTDTDELPPGLRITMRPLTWLLEHQMPGNPKQHDLEQIEASMDAHGFSEPVALDERTDLLLGGHGRLKVLARKLALGMHPPIRVVDTETGEWMVPTLEGLRSLDDADARRLNVRLNRLSERGGWSASSLTAFLADDTLLEELWSGAELDDLFGDDDTIEDDPEGTDNPHADLPPARKGPPPPPRTAQGLRELVLNLQVPLHAEVMEALATLRRAWGMEVNSLIVHRALTEAAKEARDAP